eukprot:CAMPEP_0206157544 /NCGR_PEP_ID=MMETSP1474-20131121/3998_1 /ASSEMBLY_ACC=CAM_ASM_001110 /TAXON_ID=97495 /ORGANISM="Imantonia sp., Strain RCC918" /LENGTH=333 /DNA_ID=CAMNT_0053557161 /DNA_START=347 /DNA_END=1349 /DNA_ORIENTATION=-
MRLCEWCTNRRRRKTQCFQSVSGGGAGILPDGVRDSLRAVGGGGGMTSSDSSESKSATGMTARAPAGGSSPKDTAGPRLRSGGDALGRRGAGESCWSPLLLDLRQPGLHLDAAVLASADGRRMPPCRSVGEPWRGATLESDAGLRAPNPRSSGSGCAAWARASSPGPRDRILWARGATLLGSGAGHHALVHDRLAEVGPPGRGRVLSVAATRIAATRRFGGAAQRWGVVLVSMRRILDRRAKAGAAVAQASLGGRREQTHWARLPHGRPCCQRASTRERGAGLHRWRRPSTGLSFGVAALGSGGALLAHRQEGPDVVQGRGADHLGHVCQLAD